VPVRTGIEQQIGASGPCHRMQGEQFRIGLGPVVLEPELGFKALKNSTGNWPSSTTAKWQ